LAFKALCSYMVCFYKKNVYLFKESVKFRENQGKVWISCKIRFKSQIVLFCSMLILNLALEIQIYKITN